MIRRLILRLGALGLGSDVDSRYDDILDRPMPRTPATDAIDGNRHDCVDDVHALADAADHRVATIEIVVVGLHDEELSARGILAALVPHTNDAANEGCGRKLILDCEIGMALTVVAGIAVAGVWIASLDHESGNDTMKGRSVVIRVHGQLDNLGDSLRR